MLWANEIASHDGRAASIALIHQKFFQPDRRSAREGGERRPLAWRSSIVWNYTRSYVLSLGICLNNRYMFISGPVRIAPKIRLDPQSSIHPNWGFRLEVEKEGRLEVVGSGIGGVCYPECEMCKTDTARQTWKDWTGTERRRVRNGKPKSTK